MLYDTTRCIGCKTCVVACKEANGMPPDTRGTPLHDAPQALNDRTKNIIKLFQGENEGESSYMKAQCMHCIDPACTRACMIGALIMLFSHAPDERPRRTRVGRPAAHGA